MECLRHTLKTSPILQSIGPRRGSSHYPHPLQAHSPSLKGERDCNLAGLPCSFLKKPKLKTITHDTTNYFRMWWLLYFLESQKSLHLQTHPHPLQGGVVPLGHLCFAPWAPQERIPLILIQLEKWGNKTSSYFSVSRGHHMQAPTKFRASLCHRAPETC